MNLIQRCIYAPLSTQKQVDYYYFWSKVNLYLNYSLEKFNPMYWTCANIPITFIIFQFQLGFHWITFYKYLLARLVF